MRWEIRHRTRYDYVAPVRDSFNELRLKPLTTREQRLDSFSLNVQPAARISQYSDFYANLVDHFDLPDPHTFLEIEGRL